MKPFTKITHKLFLVFVGIFMAVILAEGVVRVFYPNSRDHVIPGNLFEIDDSLGWKLAKGRSGTHRSKYFEVIYQLNDLGYRDKARNILKGSNNYRILLYGDSQIFGWGIAAEQRFSNLIEAQSRRLEIWNLSVPGYGLDQEVLSYMEHGGKFNADEVIFFVAETTLGRIHTNYIYKKQKPKFEFDEEGNLVLMRVEPGANLWIGLLYKLLSPLYLPYFVERELAMLRQSIKPKWDAVDDEEEIENTMEGEELDELARRILVHANVTARERQQRMTIITDLSKSMGSSLKRIADSEGIGFLQIDLGDEHADHVLGKDDPHWNVFAHAQISAQTQSSILKSVSD